MAGEKMVLGETPQPARGTAGADALFFIKTIVIILLCFVFGFFLVSLKE
jgi:hypothetical protein